MELERKFLLEEPTDKLYRIYKDNEDKVHPIDQYYILLQGNKEMRVRKKKRKYYFLYTNCKRWFWGYER